jgi:hypothetical protein
MGAIVPIILIVVIAVVSLAVVIGLSLGIGWVLTLFLPFSLFEGSLLGLLAGSVILFIWRNILFSIPPFPLREVEEEFEPEELPRSLFWETEADKTWERWFNYVFASAIYENLLASPRWGAVMDEEELQDISVELAEAAVAGLKTKSPRIKRLSMNKGGLKQEMIRLGQPVDDNILNVAVAAVNGELVYHDKSLRKVMQEGSWDEPVKEF